MSLQLALDAGAWYGDVIAEDNHAFLKCFFYSVRASAEDSLSFGPGPAGYDRCGPRVNVRPVYLPVKSTSVAAESYWRSCVERWHQARRHAQGVAELSYAVLAVYDALRTLPFKLHCISLYWQMYRVVFRLFCMHLLPMCQAVSLGAVTIVWLYHGRHVPICPTKPSLASLTPADMPEHLVCGLAGAWNLIWPIVIPMALVIIANYLCLHVSFMQSNGSHRTVSTWHAADGGAAVEKHGGCLHRLSTLALITWDLVFLMSAVMIPFGFIPELVACVEVALYGNRIKYHTSSKQTKPLSSERLSYGTMKRKLLDEVSLESGSSSTVGTCSDVASSSSSSRARSPSLGFSDASDEFVETRHHARAPIRVI